MLILLGQQSETAKIELKMETEIGQTQYQQLHFDKDHLCNKTTSI